MPAPTYHRHALRWITVCGALLCGIACGVVEFFALLRSRLQAHRSRG